MRLAYADPPYPGSARHHYRNHPDFAGEVDHRALIAELDGFDGWVLHTASTALGGLLPMVPTARLCAWVKPFAAFKADNPVAFAWEPVLISPARRQTVAGASGVMRDWIAEPITLRRGLAGAKPERVCRWVFDLMGATPEDELTDLFPGTGAVSRAWARWCAERPLPFDAPEQLELDSL